MKREDLSPKTIKFITEGYKRGMLTIIQGKYELFCQQVTCDELEENYKLDENKQLVTINDEDDEISDLPDCVKRLALLCAKDVELTDDVILDLVVEINNTEDCAVLVYIGGGCFRWEMDEGEIAENEFENRFAKEDFKFIIPENECTKLDYWDDDGYKMTDILDAYYNTRENTVGCIDGGGCCPMMYTEFTEETSGKATIYKILRAIVDEPTVISAETDTSRYIKCDYYGTPKDGEYMLDEVKRKVYKL